MSKLLVRIADSEESLTMALSEDTHEPLDLEKLFGHGEEPSVKEGIVAVARGYLIARDTKERAEAILKEHTESLSFWEELLYKKMEEAGVCSIKVKDDMGKENALSLSSTPYYSLPPNPLEDKSIFLWLLRSGGHDLVKRSIHHASLSSFCRELVEQGKPLHPNVKQVDKKMIKLRRD